MALDASGKPSGGPQAIPGPDIPAALSPALGGALWAPLGPLRWRQVTGRDQQALGGRMRQGTRQGSAGHPLGPLRWPGRPDEKKQGTPTVTVRQSSGSPQAPPQVTGWALSWRSVAQRVPFGSNENNGLGVYVPTLRAPHVPRGRGRALDRRAGQDHPHRGGVREFPYVYGPDHR